ncbi:MAG TPA: hypothetical protein PKJ45_15565, partial [Rubrivivax sp.]|nr:hypothetical protein [Rubrivivax sp.]
CASNPSAMREGRVLQGRLLTRVDGETWQLDEASGTTAQFNAQGRLLWQQPGKDPSHPSSAASVITH